MDRPSQAAVVFSLILWSRMLYHTGVLYDIADANIPPSAYVLEARGPRMSRVCTKARGRARLRDLSLNVVHILCTLYCKLFSASFISSQCRSVCRI